MSCIEEKVKTYAKPEVVWKAWSDNYLKRGLEVGKKGHVVANNKGVKFKIEDFKENESLTIIWYSHFIRLIFHHTVEALEKGSLVRCKVKLKGFFSFLIKPLVSGKIRKYLKISLEQFSRELNKL